MIDTHNIIVDKDLKKYTYVICHYSDDDKCATCVPKTTTKEIARAEFLEIAYQKGVKISVVADKKSHPFINGAMIQKMREPHSFEVL